MGRADDQQTSDARNAQLEAAAEVGATAPETGPEYVGEKSGGESMGGNNVTPA